MVSVEYIGYFASVCIVLSFLMKKIYHIRLINLIGCLCFVIYGFLYDPKLWPIIIPNAIICVVQIYYLSKSKS